MDLPGPAARARIGTSAWNKRSWRGRFHPIGLPQERSLRYTAERLATVEINTTFHGLRKTSDFRNWFQNTPPEFVFAVKGHRAVTHDHRLRNPEQQLARFFGSDVLLLGDKLGPILWQLEKVQPFQPQVVETFLATLPHTTAEARVLVERLGKSIPDAAGFATATTGSLTDPTAPAGPDRRIRHALEVRHPSFATPAFVELLRKYDVAAVFGPAPDRTPIHAFTSDFAYLRLHGGPGFFPDGYDDATLARWAELITGWVDGSGCPDGRPRDVFAYFDNREDDGWRPPFDAVRLQNLLGGLGVGGGDTSIPSTLW